MYRFFFFRGGFFAGPNKWHDGKNGYACSIIAVYLVFAAHGDYPPPSACLWYLD